MSPMLEMIQVSPFGVVLEVKYLGVVYFVVLVNRFDTEKTYGNPNVVSRPFIVLDEGMKTVIDDDVLTDQMEKIVQKYVINEDDSFALFV